MLVFFTFAAKTFKDLKNDSELSNNKANIVFMIALDVLYKTKI
jgi:hypothetical protein